MIQVFTLPYEWVLQQVSRNRMEEILTDADISKAKRFIHQADRDRYLTARVFLFGWLKQKDIIRSDMLELSYNSFGKPFLPGTDIYFNWSHSGDMIALIMSNRDCGIDIELDNGKELYDYQSLCTESELNWLTKKYRKTGVSRLKYFIELWTAKESVVKAKGTGLYTDPRNIEIKHEEKGDGQWTCDHESVYYGCTVPLAWKDQQYSLSYCSAQKTNVKPIFNNTLAKGIMIYI